MDNKEKAIITDLSQLRKKEEDRPYLRFAKLIFEQINQGKTRDEVLRMILKANEGLKADPREMKYFTDMVDIVFKWYYQKEEKEFKITLEDLIEEMDKNQKYLYKGKDGKDYATRAELDEANENYKNQKFKKDTTKNM